MKLKMIAAALACCLAWSPASAEPVVLKVAHFLPPVASGQKLVLQPWCDRLAQESGGQIVCQLYPALQLGGTAAQLVDQVRNGVADVVWTAPGYSPGRFPAIEALELPFVITDATSGSRAAWTFYQTHARKEFEAYKVLAMSVDGGVAIHTAKNPVAALADFKGLKLRASNRLGSQTLVALGGIPVAMPPAQMTEAISKGVVDGAMAAWEVVGPTKLDEVTKFHAKPVAGAPYVSATVLTVLMNKERYAALPADLREIIDRNSGPVLSEIFGKVWDEVGDASQAKIAAAGDKTVQITPEAQAALTAAAAPVEEDWIRQVSQKGYDGLALAAAARDLARRK